jgi:drug/metabolite transporter (DMT)-like permease
MVYLLLSLGVFAASSAAVLIRLCEAPALVIAAYRLGIAACLVLPFTVFRYGARLRAASRRDRAALLASGTLLGIHFALWISSLSHTSVASSALLVTTNPIFVGLGGWLILKERIGPRLVVGAVVSILGSAVIAFDDWSAGDHGLYGDLLALSGAMAMSCYLLIGRRQRQRLELVPYIGVVYTTAAIVLIAMAAAAGHTFTGYSDRTYVLFALLALGPQLLGHTSFNLALKRVPTSAVALALLAEPIGSTVLAYLVLAEAPAPGLYGGAGIILTGIALAVWPRNRAGPGTAVAR